MLKEVYKNELCKIQNIFISHCSLNLNAAATAISTPYQSQQQSFLNGNQISMTLFGMSANGIGQSGGAGTIQDIFKSEYTSSNEILQNYVILAVGQLARMQLSEVVEEVARNPDTTDLLGVVWAKITAVITNLNQRNSLESVQKSCQDIIKKCMSCVLNETVYTILQHVLKVAKENADSYHNESGNGSGTGGYMLSSSPRIVTSSGNKSDSDTSISYIKDSTHEDSSDTDLRKKSSSGSGGDDDAKITADDSSISKTRVIKTNGGGGGRDRKDKDKKDKDKKDDSDTDKKKTKKGDGSTGSDKKDKDKKKKK